MLGAVGFRGGGVGLVVRVGGGGVGGKSQTPPQWGVS